MYFSKYNIVTKIKNSDNYFILNALSRNADILTPEKADEISRGSYSDIDEYIAKGYLVDEEEEKKLYRKSYLDFIDGRDSSEIQIFFVPQYACNFACSYCYQDEYAWQHLGLNEDIIEAFFRYVNDEFAGRKKYITVFGGEPLLPDKASRMNMAMILDHAGRSNTGIAIVTNGYNLIDYVDMFSSAKARIREIQVTLDGTREVHNRRRALKNGQGTFDRIVQGIDAVLAAGMSINLRMVLDSENIGDLPALASFAVEKGWTGNPLFKTQMGRNYELHHCQANSIRLFDRVSLYEEIYNLMLAHPQIKEFHRPAFSVTRFLYDNGELPDPLFDSCPGCKTEWAFDYTGKIYPCTANVGKAGEEVGSFYPEKTLKADIIETWEERDVTSIPECRQCSLQLVCGGGCAAVAKNKTGNIQSPDCRPVDRLLEMGISLYYEKGVM